MARGQMESRLAILGAQLLLPVVDGLDAGHAVETPQDHARATFAPKITKEEGPIDWNQPAAAIHNRIRALQPWPLASTTLNGRRLVLRRSGVVSPAPPIGPGTVVRAHGDEIVVACGEGTYLRIFDLQPEGKRTMTAREFLAGRGIAAGVRFGT